MQGPHAKAGFWLAAVRCVRAPLQCDICSMQMADHSSPLRAHHGREEVGADKVIRLPMQLHDSMFTVSANT